MSDHLPTIVTRKYKGVHESEHTTITYRDIKNLNKEQFIAALKEAPWDSAFIFDDPNDVVDTWCDIFHGVVDRFLPLRDGPLENLWEGGGAGGRSTKKIFAQGKIK